MWAVKKEPECEFYIHAFLVQPGECRDEQRVLASGADGRTDGHLPDNCTVERPRLEVLRIFKELLLRRDFSQHSVRFFRFGVRDERGATATCVRVSARNRTVSCLSSGSQLSISPLFSSFLFFFPLFTRGFIWGRGFRGRKGGCGRVRETGSRRGFPTKAARPP